MNVSPPPHAARRSPEASVDRAAARQGRPRPAPPPRDAAPGSAARLPGADPRRAPGGAAPSPQPAPPTKPAPPTAAPPPPTRAAPVTGADRARAVGSTLVPAAVGLAVCTYSAGAAAASAVLSGACAGAALVTLPALLVPVLDAVPGYAITGTHTFAAMATALAATSALTGFSSLMAPVVAGVTGRPLGG